MAVTDDIVALEQELLAQEAVCHQLRTRLHHLRQHSPVALQDHAQSTAIAASLPYSSFQTVFEQIEIGMVQADLQTGSILQVNPAFCRWLGYTAAELTTLTLEAITDPEDYGQAIAGFTALQQGPQRSLTLEQRLLTKQGQARWTCLHTTRLDDHQGRSTSVSLIEDIHERKQAEQTLQEREQLFRAFFEQAGVGIAQIDPQGRYTLVNQKFCDLLGYTAPELLRLTAWDVTHPEDVARDRQWTQALLQQERETFVLEKRFVRADRQVLWVKLTVSAIRNQMGQLTSLLGMVEDIGSRKQAEAEWQRSRAMLQTVIDHLPQRIFWKDRQLVYQGCNRAHSQVCGCAEPAELLGKMNRDLPWTPEQLARFEHQDAEVLATQTTQTWTFAEQQPDGQIRWFYCQKIPIYDAQGQLSLILGTVADITERQQLEDLWRSQAERQQAINQVVAGIRQSLDLAQIFRTAVRAIAELLHLDIAQVVAYNAADGYWEIVAEHTADATRSSSVGLQIPDHDNRFAAQLKRGDVVQVDDVTHSVDPINQAIAQQFPGAWLLVPLMIEAGDPALAFTAPIVWGSFTLMHHQPQRVWQPSELGTAKAIAAQLAIAIQQSSLYQQVQYLNITLDQQVQERTAQLQQALDFDALLKQITDRVRDSLDESQILQTVVQAVTLGLDTYSCDAGLYDLEAQTSLIAYEYIQSVIPQAQAQVVQMSTYPYLYRQLLQGQAAQFCWLRDRNPLRPTWDQLTAFACPLIDDQAVIGDLWLYRPADQFFTDAEIRLVAQVANQCAIAMRQARLYEAAQRQVRELERLNRLKDDFLSTVSHELRTPMASIQMATQMLEILIQSAGIAEVYPLDDPQSQASRIDQYLQILKNEGLREITLINDLLDLSRLEAEIEPINLMTIQPEMWLNYLLEPFLLQAERHQQNLRVEIPIPLPMVTTDLSYLERAVTELVQNACKYTPPGEHIIITATATATHWTLYVKNSGVEISAAECDRVFDKFYRIPNHDPWKHGGTGLGLALVKRIVQTLHGTIHLESAHQWVTFALSFPLELVPANKSEL